MTATVGGIMAALLPLGLLMLVGMIGWFASDAGSHGEPREGLRVGALAWLVAHGSGATVRGADVTLLPLGLTLLCAWVTWRTGVRVGESLSGHGPDAHRIADGERDWTVPVAGSLFVGGYLLVAVAAGVLSATSTVAPSLPRALTGALLVAALVGVPAYAVGSGRAAVWLPMLPVPVRSVVRASGVVLLAHLAVSALVLAVGLILGFGDAATVLSRLQFSGTEAGAYTVVSLLMLPNVVLWASAYLVGPGFALGTGTVVSPGLVSVGELPLFPIFGAVPANGSGSGWTLALMALPFLVAVAAVAGTRGPEIPSAFDRAALHGCAAGLTAAFVVALLTVLSAGALGPGRMSELGPELVPVLVHAVPLLGVGGLVGGLLGAALRRRSRLRWRGR
ncbi:cell division protein PerM [Nocardioides limicola]|uniref:cell division protein PerM n=1 Tax=Nocardioides limicola TaxID=2803368 RepID=UPI00193BDF6D|nr:DUF6350 family protein [Nocardioides sp. DJM-14]